MSISSFKARLKTHYFKLAFNVPFTDVWRTLIYVKTYLKRAPTFSFHTIGLEVIYAIVGSESLISDGVIDMQVKAPFHAREFVVTS